MICHVPPERLARKGAGAPAAASQSYSRYFRRKGKAVARLLIRIGRVYRMTRQTNEKALRWEQLKPHGAKATHSLIGGGAPRADLDRYPAGPRGPDDPQRLIRS